MVDGRAILAVGWLVFGAALFVPPVAATSPTACFTIVTPSSGVGTTGTPFEVDASCTLPTTHALLDFSWDWGDGTTENGMGYVDASNPLFSTNPHTYANTGIYTIRLTVTEPFSGNSATTSQRVVVGPLPCTTTCGADGTPRWEKRPMAMLGGSDAVQVAASADPTGNCQSYTSNTGQPIGTFIPMVLKSYSCDGLEISTVHYALPGWLYAQDLAVVASGAEDHVFALMQYWPLTTFLGSPDILLVKFSAVAGIIDPVPLCSASLGAANVYDSPAGLVLDPASDGGLIAAGNLGSSRVLQKWDFNCASVWQTSWSGAGLADVDAIVVSGTPTIYVGAWDFNYVPSVLKYTCSDPCSSAPALAWSITGSASGTAALPSPLRSIRSVAATTDGVYLAGGAVGGHQQVVVQKLDAAGTANLWSRSTDFNGGDAIAVVRAPNGDAIASGDFDYNGPNGPQAFVTRYASATGTPAWANHLVWGGPNWSYASDLALGRNGGVLMGGGDFDATANEWRLVHMHICDT